MSSCGPSSPHLHLRGRNDDARDDRPSSRLGVKARLLGTLGVTDHLPTSKLQIFP